jgi:uncharacterized membrane protein YbhN (UPF0104 family)
LAAVAGYEASSLVLALAIVATSYLVYGSFDLISRQYTRHRVPHARVLGIGMSSYALNLNLGSLLGGMGARFWMYSRAGLKPARIAKIIALSMLTNWLGYMAVAGIVFLAFPPRIPGAAEIGEDMLRGMGFILLCVVTFYVVSAVRRKHRQWTLRDVQIALPHWRMACTQIAAGASNWLLMALIIFVLLPESVTYLAVVPLVLIGSIAGIISRVPGGLGVVEFVFLVSLGGVAGESQVLAAVLTYRALYYLIPLGLVLGMGMLWLAWQKGRDLQVVTPARRG